MLTKIKLNNIFNTLHSHPGFCFLFLVRAIKIYTAGKFQTYNKYIIIDYNHSVVHKIPRTYYPAYLNFRILWPTLKVSIFFPPSTMTPRLGSLGPIEKHNGATRDSGPFCHSAQHP